MTIRIHPAENQEGFAALALTLFIEAAVKGLIKEELPSRQRPA